MNETGEELCLRGTASYKASIGFADVYDFRVDEVLAGSFDEPRVSVIVLASDRDRSRFLAGHQHPAKLELGLERVGEDAPYAHAQVSGFVDGERRIWEIRSLRPA